MDSYTSALARLGVSPEVMDQLIAESWLGVYVDHPTAGCVYANDALLELYGTDWEGFRGFGWARLVDPIDRERLLMEISKFEQTLVPFDARFRVRRPAGDLRWVHARVRAVRDQDGKHIGSVGLIDDDTERRTVKQGEYERQRLEALGQLSARIAHDFNNLLAAMQMATDSLQEDESASMRELSIETLHGAINQASGVTRQLLTLTGRNSRQGSCLLDHELTRLQPLLQSTLGESIELELELGAGDAWIPLEAGQLGQAILNLTTNARDALGGRGCIRVVSHVIDDLIVVDVVDHGTGISPDKLETIFVPFYTTKELGRGTGLGLSILKDLVETAGGVVEIQSELGKGTTVSLRLNRVERAAHVREQRSPVAPASPGSTVLVVDDNDALRQQLGYAFAVRGWQSFTASDLAEARRYLNTPIRLLVTDVMLPDGSGVDLLREFRAVAPSLPAIVMSGFAAPDIDGSDWAPENTHMMQKPFRFPDMQEAADRLVEHYQVDGE